MCTAIYQRHQRCILHFMAQKILMIFFFVYLFLKVPYVTLAAYPLPNISSPFLSNYVKKNPYPQLMTGGEKL